MVEMWVPCEAFGLVQRGLTAQFRCGIRRGADYERECTRPDCNARILLRIIDTAPRRWKRRRTRECTRRASKVARKAALLQLGCAMVGPLPAGAKPSRDRQMKWLRSMFDVSKRESRIREIERMFIGFTQDAHGVSPASTGNFRNALTAAQQFMANDDWLKSYLPKHDRTDSDMMRLLEILIIQGAGQEVRGRFALIAAMTNQNTLI